MKTRVSAFLSRIALPVVTAIPLAAPSMSDILPRSLPSGGGSEEAHSRVRLGRAMALPTEYLGSPRGVAALERDAARPLSLCPADLDGDGVADLIAGYAGPGGGYVAVRWGNIDAIYPNEPEAQRRRAEGTFTDAPFLPETLVFEIPGAPDFLVAGDFDNDGRSDVITAAAGSSALHFLRGDGKGGLLPARAVALPGPVTALLSGDLDRADGLADLAVGLGGSRPRLLLFEGSDGALAAEPEALELPAPAAALALGRLDEDYSVDLAVAAGRELVLVSGVERPIAGSSAKRALERLSFSSPIVSVAAGQFAGARSRNLALLLEDGTLRMLERRGSREAPAAVPQSETRKREVTVPSGASLRFDDGMAGAPEGTVTGRLAAESQSVTGPPRWEEVASELAGERVAARPRRLVAARVSGGMGEDLLVLDHDGMAMRVVSASGRLTSEDGLEMVSVSSGGSPRLELLSLDFDEGTPVDLLPMRLNGDALSDLVTLSEASATPTLRISEAAATFVVTSAANGGDCNTSDGACKTDSGGSCTGPCTLRAALQQANASGGADVITFAIGAGAVTIAPTSLLPIITSPVTLDGTTQPGYAGSPIVEIDGTSAGAGNNGITVDAGPTAIRGLVVNKFGFRGIELRTSGNIVEGNYVGTNIAGTAAKPNAMDGILVFDAPSNTIGGLTAAARNVASGNAGVGIQIFGAASVGNVVRGNYAGTNAAGTGPLANAQNGVVINGAAGNTIGGTTATARNVISGNLLDGLIISGPTATANLVQGNYVGTNIAGTAAIPNAQNAGGGGMRIVAPSNTIGGTAAGAGNLVSGNFEDGIEIPRPDMSGNVVQGNLVGTDATGTLAIGNQIAGILVPLTPGATIGGTTASARNVVSGNTFGIVLFAEASNILVQGNYVGTKINGTEALPNSSDGIFIQDAANNTIGGTTGVTPAGACTGACNLVSGNGGAGVYIFDETDPGAATGNVIEGNRIGTDKNGTADLGNTQAGVVIDSAADNTVGGTTAAERNVISGNTGPGVLIGGGGATGNVVTGNYIGTKVDGTTALANGQGVFVTQGAADNAIGGTAAGAGNTIAGNTGAGVVVDPTDSGSGIAMHNPIRRNRIFSNGALGIDLGGGSVTANDDKDPDAGPNNLQNYPVISSFTLGTTAVGGTLNSTPSTTFQLDFYTSAAADPSGNGEGGTFQISTAVTTNAAGNATFNVTLPAAPPPTHVVTATATSPAGDTSEFSCAAPCRTKDLIVNTTDDDADPNVPDDFCDADLAEPGNQCTLRAAIQTANARAGTDTITFDISGVGTKTIAVAGSALSTITQPVTLDATTQSGYVDTPLVVLDGASAGAAADGLKITAGGSTVKGFIIIKFAKNGILLQGAGGNTIQGNILGTNAAGAAGLGNGEDGISINGSPNNTIGGAPGPRPAGSAQRSAAAQGFLSGIGNVLAGNLRGLRIVGTASVGNEILGNLAGVFQQLDGLLKKVANIAEGIKLESAGQTTIGAVGAGNIVSGNGGAGIFASLSRQLKVIGTKVGTDDLGSTGLGNGGAGIVLDGTKESEIGGLNDGEQNVVAANLLQGISVISKTGALADLNKILATYVGTDPTGKTGLGNGGNGIALTSAIRTIVDRTVTASNTGCGVQAELKLAEAIAQMNALSAKTLEILNSTAGVHRQIIGNIGGRPGGLDPAQARAAGLLGGLGGITKKLANTVGGACFDQIFKVALGGIGPAFSNIFAGNGGPGIKAILSQLLDVKGSFVGTDETGMTGVGNTGDGIQLDRTSQSTIGDLNDGGQNVVASNTGSGISILSAAGVLADLNKIFATYVGTDPTGKAGLGNGGNGIKLTSAIRTAIDRTVMAGNGGCGVQAELKLAEAQAQMNAILDKTLQMLNSISGAHRSIIGNIGGRPGGLDPAAAQRAGFFGGLGGITKALSNSVGGACFDQIFKVALGGVGPGLGNILTGNGGPGIKALLSRLVEVKGSFIGTDETGKTGIGNSGDGIQLDRTSESTIGDLNEGGQNVVASNTGSGISILSAAGNLSDLNKIFATYVGTDATGKAGLGNLLSGIKLTSATRTVMDRVVAAGNTGCGIEAELKLAAAQAQMNAILDKTMQMLNSISGAHRAIIGNLGGRPGGLDPAAAQRAGFFGGLGGITKALSNSLGGACFDQIFKVALGGLGPGLGNIFASNGGPGIVAKLVKDMQLQGSFVGTDETGAPGFANTGDGVRLEDSEKNIFDGNTLSGNDQFGMRMTGLLSRLNVMQRNLVGMFRRLSDGLLQALPNLQGGILLDSAPDNDIGLPVAARGLEGGAATAVGFNVISGNAGPGVTVTGATATGNAFQSNFIGTNEAGTGVFGNSSHGVFLTAGARLTVIGGPGAGTGNVIAFNGGSGVSLDASAGDGNLVDPNAIYGNAALGIDLNNDGIRTPNDAGDADGGPNELQNYPEIVSARLELNGDLVVQYKVDSAPANSDYGTTGLLVEFFQSDPGGEGKKFLGNDRYTAAEFAAGPPGVAQARLVNARGLGVTGYDSVVGSATDNDNNSSEFSLGIPVVVSVGINDVKVAEGNSGTTAATFRISLAAKDDDEVTVDYVTANGSASAPGDYTSTSGVLTFPPDTTIQNLTVQVKGDAGNEANETFVVNLTDATGAVIGDSQGVGTVLNDDGAVTSTIAPTSGPASGGTEVTLTGANYVAGAGVTFGSAPATGVSVNGPTQIEATAPALAPGTLNDVVVANPDGFTGTLVNGWLADFLDVPDAHGFHDFVERLFRSAITAGCGGGNYCPNASVTRGQMAVFLLKGKNGSGYLPPPATGTVFSDVPLGSFAADWIEQLAEEGITSGCGGGKYCPNNPVTREQMAVFLLRAKHGSSYVPPLATGDFSDVPVTSVFAPWIEQLFAEGITSGCGAGKYCPTSPNTRGQMAVFLVRTFALP